MPSGMTTSRLLMLAILGFLIVATGLRLVSNVHSTLSATKPRVGLSAAQKKHLGEWNKNERLHDVHNAKPKLRIAYCVYPQDLREGEPVLGSEYMAKYVGARAFPDREVELVRCFADPSQLPHDVEPHSRQGLELLGLINVHIRLCAWGSVKAVATLSHAHKSYSIKRYSLSQQSKEHLKSKSDLIIIPANIQLVSNSEGLPVGPLIIRNSRESWHERALGVAIQFETKMDHLSDVSIPIYMPYAYECFGRSRWNGDDPSRKIEHHLEHFGKNNLYHLRDSVTRPADFDAKKEREMKEYFMGMVNSNCKLDHPMTLIRGVFGFLVHRSLGKPVHNMGACPHGEAGALMAGLSVTERKTLHKRWPPFKGSPASVQDILGHFKFSIVFENADVNGYVTEKITTAYNAKSIPIYWGGGSKLSSVVNPKAFIRCEVPPRIRSIFQSTPQNIHDTTSSEFKQMIRDLCQVNSTKEFENDKHRLECVGKVQVEMMDMLEPHLKPCIDEVARLDGDNDAYERMLSEPLATVDENNELTGVWNETKYAEAIRAVFDVLDVERAVERLASDLV